MEFHDAVLPVHNFPHNFHKFNSIIISIKFIQKIISSHKYNKFNLQCGYLYTAILSSQIFLKLDN